MDPSRGKKKEERVAMLTHVRSPLLNVGYRVYFKVREGRAHRRSFSASEVAKACISRPRFVVFRGTGGGAYSCVAPPPLQRI